MILYIGTYTHGLSKGIYSCRFYPSTAELSSLVLAAETSNPSFLAVHPIQRFLYAANEQSDGKVSAFAIDDVEAGKLKLINSVRSGGAGPCHVAVDQSGKWLFTANYNSGSVGTFPIHPDGSLGEPTQLIQHAGSSLNHDRQEGPHPHQVVLSPDNRFVFVPDLGNDHVFAYRFDESKGVLDLHASTKTSPGAGPRHLAFRPDGKFVCVMNELLSSITAFRYESKTGMLSELQTISAIPAVFASPNTGAHIAVHPSGKFLYASNRGHDSIAAFVIGPARGTLTLMGFVSTEGKTPRHFAIDPAGQVLCVGNQDSDNIVAFHIDRTTGSLIPAGFTIQVPSPTSVAFVRSL